MMTDAQIPYVNFPNPEGFDGVSIQSMKCQKCYAGKLPDAACKDCPYYGGAGGFGFDWGSLPVIGGLISKAFAPSGQSAYDYLETNLSAIKANEEHAAIVSEVVMAVGVGLLIIGLMK